MLDGQIYSSLKTNTSWTNWRRSVLLGGASFISRDLDRIVPLPSAVEMLYSCLVEERSLPRKLGSIPTFILGALAQFTKARYKLHGEDLQAFPPASRKGIESIDVICNRATWGSPRVLTRHTTEFPKC